MNNFKNELIDLLEHRFRQDICVNKVHFQKSLMYRLTNAGYTVEKESMIKMINGLSGRINYLVTSPDGEQCVIELDNRSPRGKSVVKISSLPLGIDGFILLRDSKTLNRFQLGNIDVVSAGNI